MNKNKVFVIPLIILIMSTQIVFATTASRTWSFDWYEIWSQTESTNVLPIAETVTYGCSNHTGSKVKIELLRSYSSDFRNPQVVDSFYCDTSQKEDTYNSSTLAYYRVRVEEINGTDVSSGTIYLKD